MKKIFAILLSALVLAGGFTACSNSEGVSSSQSDTASVASENQTSKPVVTAGEIEKGSVTVYDYGNVKLHAVATEDALGDEYYIVEGENSLIGIELPSFTDDLEAMKNYIEKLDKPVEGFFICDHPAGKSYIDGVKIYGTDGAKKSIESGSTFATTDGLYQTFGDDFHGGDDMADINTVVSGSVTIDGIEFNLIDRGETYDLEIPSMNVVYTHMLGKTSHSILLSVERMDNMVKVLNEYQSTGYDMILSAHSTPEGQDAVTEKIAYVEKTKELAEESTTADEFIRAMKEAFPDYTGENYLEMSASALYAE